MNYTQNIKKQVIKVILICVILGIFINLLNDYNTEKIEVLSKNKVSFADDRASDDVMIYDKENSLFENNRLFGKSLYAYDIKNDDDIFLMSVISPWTHFGNVTLCEDRIFFQKKIFPEAGMDSIQYANINKPYEIFDTEIFTDGYVVKENNIFFVDYDMSMSSSGVKIFDISSNKIYKVPVKQKFYFDNVVGCDGDLLYYSGYLDKDSEKIAVLEFNVSTQKSKIYEVSSEYDIDKVIKKENGIMVLNHEGEIFDMRENKVLKVVELPLVDIERHYGYEDISNAYLHREGRKSYLYCATDAGRIFKVNIENGKFSEFINIEEKYDYFNHYFSEKYIFAEAILYENSDEPNDVKQKTLYIYDYNGNLVKKRILQ